MYNRGVEQSIKSLHPVPKELRKAESG